MAVKFNKTLSRLIKEKNITITILAKDLNVSRQAVYSWLNNRYYPDIEALSKLANYFNVSFDELITGEKPENKPIRETLPLDESAIEQLKAVLKNGNISVFAPMNILLSDKEFYNTLDNAASQFVSVKSVAASLARISNSEVKAFPFNEMSSYGDYKAANTLTEYFMKFFKKYQEHLVNFIPNAMQIKKQ